MGNAILFLMGFSSLLLYWESVMVDIANKNNKYHNQKTFCLIFSIASFTFLFYNLTNGI